MLSRIKTFNLLVNDYRDASDFYTQKLGFKLHQNFPEQNWVTLVVPTQTDLMITLCLADDNCRHCVGNQTASYPLFILEVDDCRKEYERMKAKGVNFPIEPQTSGYGTYAMLEDLYGNKILINDGKKRD